MQAEICGGRQAGPKMRGPEVKDGTYGLIIYVKGILMSGKWDIRGGRSGLLKRATNIVTEKREHWEREFVL